MGSESVIRLCFFLVIFGILAIFELISPRRVLTASKSRRWFVNLVILGLNPLFVRVLFPILPAGLAMLASQRNWGLLNQIGIPDWLKILSGVILLDLVVYTQHVVFHSIPVLWRLHMVHHSDLDFDLTTGLRFHPLEIVVSMCLKLLAVAALGPPWLAVIIFEVALNSTSMFSHSNIRIPQTADRLLRLLVITPDMHRVHHSVIIRETNSNFGFNLSLWDRLFGTYKSQPADGHTEMVIGLSQFRDIRKLSVPGLLILPITGDYGQVPINRR